MPRIRLTCVLHRLLRLTFRNNGVCTGDRSEARLCTMVFWSLLAAFLA